MLPFIDIIIWKGHLWVPFVYILQIERLSLITFWIYFADWKTVFNCLLCIDNRERLHIITFLLNSKAVNFVFCHLVFYFFRVCRFLLLTFCLYFEDVKTYLSSPSCPVESPTVTFCITPKIKCLHLSLGMKEIKGPYFYTFWLKQKWAIWLPFVAVKGGKKMIFYTLARFGCSF